MGVTGLWKLIEPCGKPVPVETLEGKILAVGMIFFFFIISTYKRGHRNKYILFYCRYFYMAASND